MPTHVDCFNCGETEIPIAIWDDAALSGLLCVICYDCKDVGPENSLWEVPSDVDEEDYFNVDIPAIPDEDEEWVIVDHYEGKYERFEELEIDVPKNEVFDIVVQDRENKEAINEARKEVQKIIDGKTVQN